MNISFRSWLICFFLFCVSAFFVHCSSQKMKHQNTEVPVAAPGLQSLFSDEKLFLKDSEINLSFEEETAKTAKRIAATAADGKYSVFSDTFVKGPKRAKLQVTEYLNLFNKLKQIEASELATNEESLFSETEGPCREVYKVYARVGSAEQTYFGCRGADANAARVSKIARDLEYFLLKSE